HFVVRGSHAAPTTSIPHEEETSSSGSGCEALWLSFSWRLPWPLSRSGFPTARRRPRGRHERVAGRAGKRSTSSFLTVSRLSPLVLSVTQTRHPAGFRR